jgi:hypothetical protein
MAGAQPFPNSRSLISVPVTVHASRVGSIFEREDSFRSDAWARNIDLTLSRNSAANAIRPTGVRTMFRARPFLAEGALHSPENCPDPSRSACCVNRYLLDARFRSVLHDPGLLPSIPRRSLPERFRHPLRTITAVTKHVWPRCFSPTDLPELLAPDGDWLRGC